jgi:hypothetical protein
MPCVAAPALRWLLPHAGGAWRQSTTTRRETRRYGTTGIRLLPMDLVEQLATLAPLPRVHLVRYGGCLVPHSHPRGAIMPTPRQQGVEKEATDTASLCWPWARLLKRVLALDPARSLWCPEGTLWMMAAITQGEVIRTILRHLQLAVDPPAMAPACVRQEAFAWPSAYPPRCVTNPSPPDALEREHAAVSCFPCRLPAHGVWEERHGCAAAASPQRASRLSVCHILCLGRVLYVCTRLHEASAFASVSHPHRIPQYGSAAAEASGWQPSHDNGSRRLQPQCHRPAPAARRAERGAHGRRPARPPRERTSTTPFIEGCAAKLHRQKFSLDCSSASTRRPYLAPR